MWFSRSLRTRVGAWEVGEGEKNWVRMKDLIKF